MGDGEYRSEFFFFTQRSVGVYQIFCTGLGYYDSS